MNSRISLFALAAAVLLGAVFMYTRISASNEAPLQTLHAPSGDISLIISDTPDERVQGLSDRESLPAKSAMLFVFDYADNYGFLDERHEISSRHHLD